VAVLGLEGSVAAATRFQFKRQRRHAITAAARPRPDPLLFLYGCLKRLQLARVHLREAAETAVEIEALRLVPSLQIQPRPRLRFVERPAVLGEAFLPAPVLMLVELAAKNIEPRDARQDSDEPGSTAAATLGSIRLVSASKADCSLRRSPCWWALSCSVSKA
jgi:hypothetical protein